MNNRALLLATFVTVLILAGCASSADRSETQGQAPILVQRTPGPAAITQGPIPTAVPIATWVAEGVPEDTVIEYRFVPGRAFSIYPDDREFTGIDKVITADGTVTITWHIMTSDRGSYGEIIERGRLSQDELRQLLLKFAEIDFYSLTTTGKSSMACVRYLSDPPWQGNTQVILDAEQVTVSLRMRGMQNTIHTMPSDDLANYCPEAYQRAVEMFTSLTTLLEAPWLPPVATQPAPTAIILPTSASN